MGGVVSTRVRYAANRINHRINITPASVPGFFLSVNNGPVTVGTAEKPGRERTSRRITAKPRGRFPFVLVRDTEVLMMKKSVRFYSTTDLANAVPCSESGVKGYERKNIITPQRTVGGRRLFVESDIQKIREHRERLHGPR